MFDIDEQQLDEQQQQSTKNYNYSYISESALLSDYLVHIRPVIPIIKNDEAEYDTAVISTINNIDCPRDCMTFFNNPQSSIY
jgi:hypothetical protein